MYSLLSASLEYVSALSPWTLSLSILCLFIASIWFSSFFLSSAANLPPFVSLPKAILSGSLELSERGPLALLSYAWRSTGGADLFRFSFFGFSNITVCLNHEALAFFCESKDTQLAQQPVYGFMRSVFGPGVVYDAPYKIFFQQLKFLAQGLSQRVLMKHTTKVLMEAEKYFNEKWGNEGTVDLLTVMSELILLTASRCLLGPEIRDRLHSRFAQLYHELSHGIDILGFFAPNLPTPAHRKRDQAREKIREMFAQVIRERREKMVEMEKGNKEENEHKETVSEDKGIRSEEDEYVEEDFLESLMRVRYTDGRALTDEEIIGMLLAALFAGQHTSNITSTWLGFCLAKHWKENNLGQRLQEEQKILLEKYSGQLTFDTLAEMDLLHKSMKETLRLFPPLIFLMRKTLVPLQYKQYTIPANEIIVCSPAFTHRLPTFYNAESADNFFPDRFSLPHNEDSKHKFAFTAFGGGLHKCLGERFAFMQIKTIWSVLLRNFEFEIVGQFPKIDFASLVTGPLQPCLMKYKRIQPRNAAAATN